MVGAEVNEQQLPLCCLELILMDTLRLTASYSSMPVSWFMAVGISASVLGRSSHHSEPIQPISLDFHDPHIVCRVVVKQS